MDYKVYPLALGDYWIDRSRLAYMDVTAFNQPYHLTHGFFALKNQTKNVILVDSGCPSPEDVQQAHLPFPVSANGRNIEEALKEINVKPTDISQIILTHLHWDHSWNLDQFPNAEILVQREELGHAVTPYKHEKEEYCMTKETFMKGWTNGILRVRALNGDSKIRDGIHVILTPGHTPGSQSILVDTADGSVIFVGDWAYQEENWTQQKAPADTLDFDKWFQSYDRIISSGARIIPTHLDTVYKDSVIG